MARHHWPRPHSGPVVALDGPVHGRLSQSPPGSALAIRGRWGVGLDDHRLER
jgi:hypothetical protein